MSDVKGDPIHEYIRKLEDQAEAARVYRKDIAAALLKLDDPENGFDYRDIIKASEIYDQSVKEDKQ